MASDETEAAAGVAATAAATAAEFIESQIF